MKLFFHIFLISIISIFAYERSADDHNIEYEIENSTKILSRRKRFLIFPEGSSLQLVFCLTYPMISPIGDIVLWGYTAALAYELPQDPYSPFMHHADPLHRRMDTKVVYFTDEKGKVLFKKPYTRKPIMNPAFAKRSVDAFGSNADKFKKGMSGKFEMDRKRMHALKQKREFLKTEHMDENSVEFHRSSRANLYGKIETLYQTLGGSGNGRECTLKSLCLVGQTESAPQGNFIEEILRAVFTLPKGREYLNEYQREYDTAHSLKQSCDILYPNCNFT